MRSVGDRLAKLAREDVTENAVMNDIVNTLVTFSDGWHELLTALESGSELEYHELLAELEIIIAERRTLEKEAEQLRSTGHGTDMLVQKTTAVAAGIKSTAADAGKTMRGTIGNLRSDGFLESIRTSMLTKIVALALIAGPYAGGNISAAAHNMGLKSPAAATMTVNHDAVKRVAADLQAKINNEFKAVGPLLFIYDSDKFVDDDTGRFADVLKKNDVERLSESGWTFTVHAGTHTSPEKRPAGDNNALAERRTSAGTENLKGHLDSCGLDKVNIQIDKSDIAPFPVLDGKQLTFNEARFASQINHHGAQATTAQKEWAKRVEDVLAQQRNLETWVEVQAPTTEIPPIVIPIPIVWLPPIGPIPDVPVLPPPQEGADVLDLTRDITGDSVRVRRNESSGTGVVYAGGNSSIKNDWSKTVVAPKMQIHFIDEIKGTYLNRIEKTPVGILAVRLRTTPNKDSGIAAVMARYGLTISRKELIQRSGAAAQLAIDSFKSTGDKDVAASAMVNAFLNG